MAAVFTKTYERDLGNGVKLVTGTLAFDSSYPTGGEAVDLSSYFPGGTIIQVMADPCSSGGYVVGHDYGTPAAGKFMAYWCDYDAGADGALVQVTATTDLSALTAVHVTILGH